MRLKNQPFRLVRAIHTPIFFFIFAIIVDIIGVLTLSQALNTELVDVSAKIVEISPSYDDESSPDVWINYTFDETDYEHVLLGGYDASWSVGETINVKIDPASPEQPLSDVGFMPYLLLGVAAVALIIGIASIKRTKRENAVYKEFAAPKNSVPVVYQPEEGADERSYFFHPDKHFTKAGSLMEDCYGRIIYEGKFRNFTLFRAAECDFINHLTGYSAMHKIGHTVTANADNFYADSSFTYDGEPVFTYLHRKGVRLETDLTLSNLSATYTVIKGNVAIARATMCGARGFTKTPENWKERLGNIGAPGYFQVEMHNDEDLDLVFLALFAMARTEMTVYH